MATEYVTIRDVASCFNVSVSTIRNWVKAGTIPASTYIKAGETYRFNLGKIEEALLNTSSSNNEHNVETNQ